MRGKLLNSEVGQTLAEFAIVLLALIPLVFGTMELQKMLLRQQTLAQAAVEGARFAAVYGGDVPYVRQRIEQQLRVGGIDPASATVTIAPVQAPWGEPVTVRIQAPARLAIPLLWSRDYTLSAEYAARSEKD